MFPVLAVVEVEAGLLPLARKIVQDDGDLVAPVEALCEEVWSAGVKQLARPPADLRAFLPRAD